MLFLQRGYAKIEKKMNLGSKSFWTKEYKHQIAKMVGICYRYVPVREVAEDLAHDAFLKAIEKADTFRGTGSFDKWLMRITVNTALQYLRENPQSSHPQDIESLEDVIDNSTDDIPSEDMMSAIRRADFTQEEILEAIAQLPEHHRVVLNLYVFEHLSHKEISALLNISTNTSRSHLLRARKELQVILFNKSKRKKRTLMVLLPLLFGPDCAIDGYCRRQLRGFAIVPRRTLTETGFPDTVHKPLPMRMKLRAARIPLAVGATTATVSALLLPFLLSPTETATPPLPMPAPAPTAIDSCTKQLPDYQEIPNPVSADSITRTKTRKQPSKAVAPSAPTMPPTIETDTIAKATDNVVIKKVKRTKRQTIVIEGNTQNTDTNE